MSSPAAKLHEKIDVVLADGRKDRVPGRQSFLEDREGPREERLGRVVPAGCPVEHRQVVEPAGEVRVIGAVRLHVDGDSALEERLGRAAAPGCLVKPGEVVERGGELGMVAPVRSLVDGDGALEEKLGRAVAAGGPIEGGQLVEGDGQRGMVAPFVRPVDGGGALDRSLGPAMVTGGQGRRGARIGRVARFPRGGSGAGADVASRRERHLGRQARGMPQRQGQRREACARAASRYLLGLRALAQRGAAVDPRRSAVSHGTRAGAPSPAAAARPRRVNCPIKLTAS